MREITLLLVLANLAFLGWDRWIAPTELAAAAVPARPLPPNLQRLALATELTAPQVSGSAAASTVAPAESESGTTVSPAIGDEAGEGVATPAEEATPAPTIAPDTTTSLITQEVPADARTTTPGTNAFGAPATGDTNTQDTRAETVALLAATPAPHCVSIGPYLDLAETAEAAARLRERGHLPSQRLADSPLWVGNWVYLAPFQTRAEAVAAVEKLRGQGVADLYVEPSGEDENAVSLGLYSDRERAEALAETIRKYGYTPHISDKYRVASVYWVDVVLPPNVTIDPAKYQVRNGRAVRVETHECPDGTAMPGVVADANEDDQ